MDIPLSLFSRMVASSAPCLPHTTLCAFTCSLSVRVHTLASLSNQLRRQCPHEDGPWWTLLTHLGCSQSLAITDKNALSITAQISLSTRFGTSRKFPTSGTAGSEAVLLLWVDIAWLFHCVPREESPISWVGYLVFWEVLLEITHPLSWAEQNRSSGGGGVVVGEVGGAGVAHCSGF